MGFFSRITFLHPKSRYTTVKLPFLLCFLLCLSIVSNSQTASFTTPDTVCVNTPINITNTSTNATTNFWNFCVADINTPPTGLNLGNPGGFLSAPVFMDYVLDNGNYYGFVTNYDPGGLTRLDFGNSLLNTPTPVFLGNVGGVMNASRGSEGIQVVKNEGHWYAFIVGGSPSNVNSVPKLVKIDFGTNITNTTPIATDYGNLGNMLQPIDFHLFSDGGNWYGFTVNSENNTITQFNFTNSFNNTPTATNIGNPNSLLSYPTGIFVINNNGQWHAFITNDGAAIENSANSFIVRLDFGSSLLNTPVGTNLGNPGGLLRSPRDLYITKHCSEIVGFIVNYSSDNDIVRFNFYDNLQNTSNATRLGNIGNLSFPHSISKIFREGADLYSFVTNVNNNTLTRLKFAGCNNASIPNSSLQTPPPITYTTPGTYNINLTIDEGLPTENSFCKKIVVTSPPNLDFNFIQDNCNPLSIQFNNVSPTTYNFNWNFGDGSSSATINPSKLYQNYNNYTVTLSTAGCADTIKKTIPVQVNLDSLVTNHDTAVCKNSVVQLQGLPALNYCWTPSTNLSNNTIANPIANPTATTTYYLNSQIIGKNMIFNANFSLGNTGFSSDYHDSINGYHEGTYRVDTNAKVWHPFLAQCNDHTTGKEKMMLVNGASIPDVTVWKQNISNIQTYTNYVFSVWIQSLYKGNPAQLQFSINGKPIGDTFTAPLDTCSWHQFFTSWNAGTSTSAVISIVNKDTIANGNDFTLDDLSFYPITLKRDSVTITIIDPPTATATLDTSICLGQSVQLVAAAAQSYKWAASPFIANPSLRNQTIKPNTATNFTVDRFNSSGCFITDTINVNILTVKASLDFSFTEDICNPLSLHFKNESTNSTAYSWSFGGNSSSTDVNPSITFPNYSTYKVTLQNTDGCVDSITKFLPLNLVTDSLITTNDTLICASNTLQLNALPALAYCWNPAADISNATIAAPTVTPVTTSTYYVNAETVGVNLVTNGDFTKGYSDFTSLYTYSPNTGKPAGTFTVATSPFPWHPTFSHCTDHTTGNGNMLLVNGANIAGVAVWSETVPIQPNTNYAFSLWLESISGSNPAQLQFSINNKTIGNLFTAASNTCEWREFFIVWNSGNATTADLSIVNNNTNASGNDFALDDISFGQFLIKRDSINVQVRNNPIVKILNTDTALCGLDSFTLKATGANNYQWSGGNTFSSPNKATTLVKPTTTKQFFVQGSDNDGCSTKDSINVTVNPLPALTVTKNTGLCLGDSIVLTAQSDPANSYQWQFDKSLSATNIANPKAFPSDTTTYFVRVTDNNNCFKTDSVTIEAWPIPTVKTRPDTTICLQTFIVLQTTSNGANISWQPVKGLSNPNIANPADTALSLIPTKYTVTATSNKGCAAKDSITISVNPLPATTVNTDSAEICFGKSASLQVNANNINTYNWFPIVGLTNPAAAATNASPTSSTTYYITVTDNNQCHATDSVYVGVKQLPNFAINPIDGSVCNGDSIAITASGGNKYKWQTAPDLRYPDSAINFVHPTIATTYKVLISDTICSLSNTFSAKIAVNNPPIITLSKSNDVDCIITTAKLTANGAATYSWSPAELLLNGINNTATPVAIPNQTTRYQVKAYSIDGCETDSAITVKVTKNNAENGYYVPSAFVPISENKINQRFGVTWNHVTTFQMNIYNRFGQKIFSTTDMSNLWDGRQNNNLLEAGTYVYEIMATTICGEIFRKGAFVLIR